MTRPRTKRVPSTAAVGGMCFGRLLVFALLAACFAFSPSCSKEETCGDKCREEYEDCLARAGDDENAILDCGEQRTDCFNACVSGFSSVLVAPEALETRDAPKDTKVAGDDCPCAVSKRD